MKIIKTVVIDVCFIVVLFWVLVSSLICLFVPVPVSAASVPFPTDYLIKSGVSSSIYLNAFEALKSNDYFRVLGDCYVTISYSSNSQKYYVNVFVLPWERERSYNDGWYGGSTSVFYSATAIADDVSLSALSNYHFQLVDYNINDTQQPRLCYNSNIAFPWFNQYFFANDDGVRSTECQAIFYFSSSFTLEDYEVVNPFFSLDVDDFYTWLVNNDKIDISGSSGGVSVGGKIPSYIGTQKLKSFLEFYKQFGSSNRSFVQNIVAWFSHMNIFGQTKDNINVLKNTTDQLYQEYINYRSGTHAYWPSASKIQKRQNIDTVTDDDHTILITDDNSDTLDISILRDILRGVIAISNNLNQGVSDIVSALNRLDFTVNVANDGGAGFSSSDIWGSGSITESENYLALTAAFMDKGVDVSAAENMQINYLDNATQSDSFTVSVVMPDAYVNGQFTEKTVTHTIDNTSKMYNTLILFRKLIAFAVVAYFAIRIRFELPYLIRGE